MITLCKSSSLISNAYVTCVLCSSRLTGIISMDWKAENQCYQLWTRCFLLPLKVSLILHASRLTLLKFISAADVSHIVLAMPHRGRLNLLTDLLNYNPTALFHKVRGGAEIPEGLGAEGDVISHLGQCPVFHSHPIVLTRGTVSSTVLNYGGNNQAVKVSLLPNPSHLGKSL